MSDEFDPYYKWLGIPPAEQPPNHYRLLGIQLCEPDLDVISNAADQRMAHIRTYQSGKYSEASQRLLNKISTARVLLLSPTKEQYDRNLRSSVSSTAAQPAHKPLTKAKPLPARRADVPSAEPRSAEDTNPFDTIVNVAQPTHDVARRKSPQPMWQNPVLLGVAGVLTLLLVCGVMYFLVSGPDNESVARKPELPPGNVAPARTQSADTQQPTPAPTKPDVAVPDSSPPPVEPVTSTKATAPSRTTPQATIATVRFTARNG
jgi:hypothetical protein